MTTLLAVLGTLVLVCALGYVGAPLALWAIALGAWVWILGASWIVAVVIAAPLLALSVPAVRRAILTAPIFRTIQRMGLLPKISPTERTAIEAGTVWVDGELFSGRPNFGKLMSESYADLTEEERAFLEGPVEEVCRMVDDWEVWKRRDLPEGVWQYLKEHRFFGLIVPKEFDGLGFSPSGNSAIVKKLSSASGALGISVMVPNSLGPAELLLHYGTDAQKKHYLPRLARGEEMPAFALTEPGAGSDAASMTSTGVVFRGEDGKLYLRLQWNKRYISLAGIATVLGLAFKLRDPDNLLGKGEDLGITCALVPTHLPGVVVDRRHDPLGVPFWNCPTEGHDVVVPLEDAIIGGVEGAGNGWRMLMESLAAGRGISLPAAATAGAQGAAAVTGAYAAVRKQFGLPIGRFEGIEEPLARIGGAAYTLEAARRYTCGGLDSGAKPAVVTAMAKYNFTEIMRRAINDAMDVLGGAAISRGPRNKLAHGYIGIPIMITVEGANILTRTLMIFGQGAIRCHPYAYKEIAAMEKGDVAGFDRAFWGHVGHVVRNGFRSVLLSLTRGALARAPVSGPTAGYFRKLSWASASFAFFADLAMAGLGGDLKRKEKITGRFADIFSWLYLGTAVLRRFEAEGRRPEDLPLVHQSMQEALWRIQQAFDGLLANLNLPGIGWLLRGPVALWSRLNPIGTGPSDRVGSKVARALQTPGEQRERLTAGIFHGREDHPSYAVERAFVLCTEADAIARKIREAVKHKKLPKGRPERLVPQAVEAGVITAEEAEKLQAAEAARAEALAVDSFTHEEYLGFGKGEPTPEPKETVQA